MLLPTVRRLALYGDLSPDTVDDVHDRSVHISDLPAAIAKREVDGSRDIVIDKDRLVEYFCELDILI